MDGSASNDSGHLLGELRQALMLCRVRYGAESMSALDALALGTTGGAGLLRRPDLGALETGRCADVAIFPAVDVFSSGHENPVDALLLCWPRQVKSLVVGGRVRIDHGAFVDLDLPGLVARHPRPRPAVTRMKTLALILALALAPLAASARPSIKPPFYVSLIDQLPPQVAGPSINGLDERRRGPIFAAALRQASDAGKLPPVTMVNRDLSIPATTADEPKVQAGAPLVRIYLTQWSQTRLGGIADTRILCRFYVELRRDSRVEKKLGPFFAQPRFDMIRVVTPEDRWAQFQAAARMAIEEMAAALAKSR